MHFFKINNDSFRRDISGIKLVGHISISDKVILNKLFDEKENIKLDGYIKEKALRWAASSNNVDVLKKLLTMGIDLNATDDAEETALMWAAKFSVSHTTAIIQLLLDNGADPNIRNADGWTALILAVQFSTAKAVEVLLKHKADVDAVNNCKETALLYAVHSGLTEKVQLLVNYGANPNVVDASDMTAFMYAVQKCKMEIIIILLTCEVDLTKNMYGVSALSIAEERQDQVIIDLVREAECTLNSQRYRPFK